MLVEAGVNVKQGYGSTELGPLMRTYPHETSHPSLEPLRLCFPENPHLRMDHVGDDGGDDDGSTANEEQIFELVADHG